MITSLCTVILWTKCVDTRACSHYNHFVVEIGLGSHHALCWVKCLENVICMKTCFCVVHTWFRSVLVMISIGSHYNALCWVKCLENVIWGWGLGGEGQRDVLACQRSQVRILAVALNQLFVLICFWLREVAVRERLSWLPVCCVTRVPTHTALSA
jgi:hypothetical protein